MRFLIIVLMLFVGLNATSQSKKSTPAQTPKPVPEPEKSESEQLQIVNNQNLMQHFINKYAAANRWNDPLIARSALYDIILMNPANDSIIFTLAYDYFENQQFASALLITQDLLTVHPKNPMYLEVAGIAAEELGVLDRALQHFESLYLLTDATQSLYKVAFIQFGLKRYEEAAANTNILLTRADINNLKVVFDDAAGNPKEYTMKVAILNLKGLVELEKGDKATAKKTFTEALSMAPDFIPAKQNLEKTK